MATIGFAMFLAAAPSLLPGAPALRSAVAARGARADACASGFAVDLSRRRAVSAALASAALPLVALPALAADGVREISPSTTRMGGLLDAFSDISKGFSVYKPSTWNKFDGTPGEYEAKWQDLIGYTEQIIVSSSPVTSGKGIDALGSASELGAKVAKLRDLTLVSAEAVKVGELLMYIVELAGQGGHEAIGFTVSKGKLWRITTKASDKKWAANKEMYMNVITSFQNRIL